MLLCEIKKVVPSLSTAQNSTSSLIAVGLLSPAALPTRYFRLGSFKALMTAVYGHLPVRKIALFVDEDVRAFWQCKLQRLEFLYLLFGNLLLV